PPAAVSHSTRLVTSRPHFATTWRPRRDAASGGRHDHGRGWEHGPPADRPRASRRRGAPPPVLRAARRRDPAPRRLGWGGPPADAGGRRAAAARANLPAADPTAADARHAEAFARLEERADGVIGPAEMAAAALRELADRRRDGHTFLFTPRMLRPRPPGPG